MKYRLQQNAAEYLKNKLKTGGTGVWGDVPMPPQVALSSDDADKLVAAILGLSEGITETKGAMEGKIKLAPDFGADPGGAWEISVQAPDYSPASIRIPAK